MTDGELVAELCAIETGLTGWEMDFIESLARWLEEHGELTPAQREKAEQIFDDRT